MNGPFRSAWRSSWALPACLIFVAAVAYGGTAGTETYTYDVLGRLRTITFPDGTKSTYDYDLAGNRLLVATGADIAAPSAPTGLTAIAPSSTTVNLSWAASTDTGGSGLAGYKIYRNGSTTPLATTVGSGTTYSDTTTAGTTAYTYIVKGYDGKGNISGPSNTASVTTPDTIAPSVPTGLTAAAVLATQVNLSWTGSTDTGGSGLKGYKITRNGAALVTTTSTATTYNDTGLAASTTYSYTVAAYDNANNISSASAIASVTTPSGTYSDGGTLTQGLYHSATGPNWSYFKGYRTIMSPVIGSYAPTALTGGKAVASLFDFAVCSSQSQPYNCPYSGIPTLTQYGQMTVSGFSADPGAAWLVSVTVGGVVRSGTTATYSYSGGTASWQWTGATGSFGLTGSGAISATVVHK